MVYRLKMEDAGIVVGKAGQRCALAPLQDGMPRQSAVGARLPATGCVSSRKFVAFRRFLNAFTMSLWRFINFASAAHSVAGRARSYGGEFDSQ